MDPIAVSPTPANIKIIQPIQFVSSTERTNNQFLSSSPSSSFSPSTSSSSFSSFSSPASPFTTPPSQRRRLPKQQQPALSFLDEDRTRQSARQETSPGLEDLPDLTPLGVRLSLEDMVRTAGEGVEMRPIPGEPGVDYPVWSSVPDTDFNCRQQEYPGIYTDTESNCQVETDH